MSNKFSFYSSADSYLSFCQNGIFQMYVFRSTRDPDLLWGSEKETLSVPCLLWLSFLAS